MISIKNPSENVNRVSLYDIGFSDDDFLMMTNLVKDCEDSLSCALTSYKTDTKMSTE